MLSKFTHISISGFRRISRRRKYSVGQEVLHVQSRISSPGLPATGVHIHGEEGEVVWRFALPCLDRPVQHRVIPERPLFQLLQKDDKNRL